ncbi:hypothetical protein E2C01_075110 [Portunus trituberculatus]|uniref:Uncharacterized protein n=1 Tax=Portunus trituberculatus TaxID=210409 RepID=A0A5B7I7M2_PORTR|nr:hypothetical protein [Portunus trituberculatus]
MTFRQPSIRQSHRPTDPPTRPILGSHRAATTNSLAHEGPDTLQIAQ